MDSQIKIPNYGDDADGGAWQAPDPDLDDGQVPRWSGYPNPCQPRWLGLDNGATWSGYPNQVIHCGQGCDNVMTAQVSHAGMHR